MANVQVLKVVLSPNLNIRPGIIAYKTECTTPLGITVLANSITLTPGTVTVALRDGDAIVHAISEENAQDMEGGDMDQRVRMLERPFATSARKVGDQ